MNEAYDFLKTKIRRRKADIETEINRRFEYSVRPTDLMCATWNVKQILDRMRSDVDELILCEDSISYKEAKVLYRYIDNLDDYVWSRLYDIAGKGVIN